MYKAINYSDRTVHFRIDINHQFIIVRVGLQLSGNYGIFGKIVLKYENILAEPDSF